MSKELQASQSKQVTLSGMLSTYKAEIARALPRHVTPDRMLRMAMTSARKNPDLLECTPESFLGAVIQSAQLGLEPDTPLGQAYLIPFFNGKSPHPNKREVNFMVGYRGFMDLIYRVQRHPILWPVAVYEGDHFEYSHGLTPTLIHSPAPRAPNAVLTHVYCTAEYADGRKPFDAMTRAEIEAIRMRSKAQRFSPWQTDYEPMAKKTVIRRMAKYLPMSAELQLAAGLDALAESGESQQNDLIIREGDAIQTKRERVTQKMESFDGWKPND